MEQTRLLVEELDAGHGPPDSQDTDLVVRRRNAEGAWETAIMPLPLYEFPEIRFDAERLRALGQRFPLSTMTWEARLLAVVPMRGEAGEDDYWARVLLCVDHASGFVLSSDVLEPGAGVQDAFLGVMERAEYIPQALMVTSGLLHRQLSPVTEALGIELEPAEELPGVDEAAAAMKAALRR